jgi:hypothetical protein
MLGGHDQIALILAVGIIHDDDHPAIAEIGNHGFDRIKSCGHFVAPNLLGPRINASIKSHPAESSAASAAAG